jgi:putative phosphoribosyl transferase
MTASPPGLDALAALALEADEAVCLQQPRELRAIGLYYRDFRQVEDSEVVEMLAGAGHRG